MEQALSYVSPSGYYLYDCHYSGGHVTFEGISDRKGRADKANVLNLWVEILLGVE